MGGVRTSPTRITASEAGFAVLTPLRSYFESIAAFMKGESSDRQSTAFFVTGFLDVFSEFESQAIAYGVPHPQKALD
jgi:hypothetical protein